MKKLLCLTISLFFLVSCSPKDNKTQDLTLIESSPVSSSIEDKLEFEQPINNSSSIKTEDNNAEQQPDDVTFFEDESGSGFISPNGEKILLSDKYDFWGEFYDERLIALNQKEEPFYPYPIYNLSVLDVYGNLIIESGLYNTSRKKIHYENELLLVSDNNLHLGILGINGEIKLPFEYETVLLNFETNRNLLYKLEGEKLKAGYANNNFETVIDFKYESASSFKKTEKGYYAIVSPISMKLYQDNVPTQEIVPNMIFNYQIINQNGDFLYNEEDLIYVDWDIYQKYREIMGLNLSRDEDKNEYIILDKSTMLRKEINLKGLWTWNYETSYLEENPQWLSAIKDDEIVEVYMWDENTEYEIRPISELFN